MYKITNKIEDVLHEFILFDDCIVVAKIEGGIEMQKFNTNGLSNEWKLEMEPLYRLALIGNKIIASNANGEAYTFNIEGSLEKKLDNNILIEIPNLEDGNSLIFSRLNGDKVTEKINIISDEKYWSKKYRIGKRRLISSGQLFFTYYLRDYELYCINLETGEIVSGLNIRAALEKIGVNDNIATNVAKILRDRNGLLYFVLENNVICSWSMEDGAMNYDILKEMSLAISSNRSDFAFNFIQSIFLSDSLNIIVGLSHNEYWAIDLDKKQIIAYDHFQDFTNQEIIVSSGGKITIRDGHIFFCSNFLKDTENGKEYLCKIGAFNIIQQKITWTHQFDFEPGVRLQSPAPEIIDDKLFVLDTKNRLHIFQETPESN